MYNIGLRIKELRKDQKLTQTEFGKLFGVTHAHISSIEKGKENPSEMFMLFIAEKLHINETWLRTGEGEKYPILEFNTHTDQGNISKFEYMNEELVNFVKKSENDELKIIVNIISYFDGEISNNDFTDKEKHLSYLKELEAIMATLSKLFAKANGLSILKEKKDDFKTLLRFSTKANYDISDINNSIRNILNLYIEKYISDEQIGFKIF